MSFVGQYSNYVMEAQQNLANHMGMNNSNPIPQQNMMFTPAAASAEKAETTMVPNSMAPVPVSFSNRGATANLSQTRPIVLWWT
mgnify:FL=1